MGNTIDKNEVHIDSPRLMGNRLAVDLCENIHLHYRDLRLEFSHNEWNTFAQFITETNTAISDSHCDYDGTDPDYFAQFSKVIPAQSDHWPNRINTEVQGPPFEGIMHIHYNDLRIELPVSVYNILREIINSGEVKNEHY
jgi:hypothetical protein